MVTQSSLSVMLRKHHVRTAVPMMVLLALGLLSGCSSSNEPEASATQSSAPAPEENPYGVLTIDPPAADEAILTVDGKGSDGSFTTSEFTALGATEVTLFEPFVKQTQTFVGVPLSTIVEALGIDPASDLLTVALNDYRWTGNVGQMLESQALVAYQVDGRDIGYDEGGPIRLVYPDGTALSTNLDAWNWSLAQLVEQ